MTYRLAMLVLLAILLGACARPGASPAGSDTGTDASSPGGGSSEPATAPEGIPDIAWVAILADLERRIGGHVDPEVVSAEAVTWNDGSLGCPEAGMSYTQALVDGYQVVLEVDGERYDYRVGSGDSVKLCEGGPLEGGG